MTATIRRLPLGSKVCECTVCRELFTSDTPFSKHRVGEIGARRCLTPDEMRARGMVQVGQGRWASKANSRPSRVEEDDATPVVDERIVKLTWQDA